MFEIMQWMIWVILKPYDLGDRDACHKFFQNVFDLARRYAATGGELLEKDSVQAIQWILENPALFDYVYTEIKRHWNSNEIVEYVMTEDAFRSELSDPVSGTGIPETVNPLLVISLVIQIISLLNKMKLNDKEKPHA